ncbi:S41 family peptidase [Undibacterium sp. CCC3.4]|uniref:S41 family peptidase n=1 Tax=Undibacterium sp. CCC3.4 TaxID=3048609 RepID=UPI002B22F94A|nr:S41 family peptidase [Undibacterium sp. CCC3.4]MEB0175622.1 S41 family peptidase [Undibacterium sp. CCC3.4]
MKILFVPLCLAALLTACGGGGGGGSGGSSSSSAASGSSGLPSAASLANQCATPRAGTIDVAASAATEKAYLRSFVDETYLWYTDVPSNLMPATYSSPQTYFDALKTMAVTASGTAVDQFHWSQTSASWAAASAGIAQDYGIQWAAQSSAPPRNWIVAGVAAASPAALLGIVRGDQLSIIDGIDFINDNSTAGIAKLNEALAPSSVAAHVLTFKGKAAVSLTPAIYPLATVNNVSVLQTASGAVGYFIFDSHIAKSEAELSAAISQLKAAGVTDLIIDLRYNGGGLLYIASELAYMVAGPSSTHARIFEKLTYNDKQTAQNTSYPFYSSTVAGLALPTLNLKHVSLLVTRGTASASESVINSLRGVDVKVDLIGAATRGKPYGFVPQDNCGWTYFAIQFKGVNDKLLADYADGFAPTCAVADDFTHQRGDTAEALLKTALAYRQNAVCPIAPAATTAAVSAASYRLVRPPSSEMRILSGR